MEEHLDHRTVESGQITLRNDITMSDDTDLRGIHPRRDLTLKGNDEKNLPRKRNMPFYTPEQILESSPVTIALSKGFSFDMRVI
jgi:hypothetical protein